MDDNNDMGNKPDPDTPSRIRNESSCKSSIKTTRTCLHTCRCHRTTSVIHPFGVASQAQIHYTKSLR